MKKTFEDSLACLLDYCEADEARSYEECESEAREGHIYTHIEFLRNELERKKFRRFNGVPRDQRIERTLDGMFSDSSYRDTLRVLCKERLEQLDDKEIANWWELKEDIT